MIQLVDCHCFHLPLPIRSHSLFGVLNVGKNDRLFVLFVSPFSHPSLPPSIAQGHSTPGPHHPSTHRPREHLTLDLCLPTSEFMNERLGKEHVKLVRVCIPQTIRRRHESPLRDSLTARIRDLAGFLDCPRSASFRQN